MTGQSREREALMETQELSLKVEFRNTRRKAVVPLSDLITQSVDFLEYYGELNLVGREFHQLIGEGDGRSRFSRLLKASGYSDDPHGFFRALMDILEKTNSYEVQPMELNGVTLPQLFVYGLLEQVLPGNRFIKIRSVSQLENLTNIRISDEKREKLQKVISLYPVRLSMHTIRQMRISPAIAYQYMPFTDELNREGKVHTWVGQFHRGIVEQMYRNRVIFVLNMACPVYCRFCFRKHKECRNQPRPTKEHVVNALAYIRNVPNIREIVLTGGDPFMNRVTLNHAIDGLSHIPHVQTLRVATRSISYFPHLFYANNGYWMNFLKMKSLELEARGKRLEVATHFIHPHEVSLDSLDLITELVQNGISVYIQTPLLKDCNDGTELRDLYRKLRGAGAEMHYIYMPCSPIKGNRSYVTTLVRGMEVFNYLRAYLSDRAMPRLCTATHIGKIDWNQSGWVVEQDKEDEKYIWIRTPYTKEYFSRFAPILQLRKTARVNAEGTLDARFMAETGDDALIWGSRIPGAARRFSPGEHKSTWDTADTADEELDNLRRQMMKDPCFTRSIVNTGSETLLRTHKTRVELDLDADDEAMKRNLDYIREDDEITDLVINRRSELPGSFYRLKHLQKDLDGIPHVTALRIRCLELNYHPARFTMPVINQLARMNKLSIVNPRRLEIETLFLHSSEFRPEHKTLAGNLRKKGITVYSNTPLLPFINDSPEEMARIAGRLRESGIEFHHLYIAGLPIQTGRAESRPVNIDTILDIATEIRRSESGRGIPRFIISTVMGEVDFGLTSDILEADAKGRIIIKLKPYTLAYYQSMDPEFKWPKGVKTSKHGHPVIPVPGLKRTQEFLVD